MERATLNKKIRVFLVDDHAIVRLGLTALLGDQPDIEIVGEAGTAAETMSAIEKNPPDVVLMDIRLPGESGIELTRQIVERFPSTRVLILTSYADDDLIARAICAGAIGYILKQVEPGELLRAIRAAARGESTLDSVTATRVLTRIRELEHKVADYAFHPLSHQELKVLCLLARGRTNAEIAKMLHLSEKTVENYVGNMLDKLGLKNRVELAAYAYEHHLFERVEHLPE